MLLNKELERSSALKSCYHSCILVGSSATIHAIETVDPPKSPSRGGETTSTKFHAAGKHAAGLFRMSALGLTLRVKGTEFMQKPQPTDGTLAGFMEAVADETREVFASSTFC